MFDFSDHTLTTISTWAEVAILVFMFYEYAEPRIRARLLDSTAPEAGDAIAPATQGFWRSIWTNRIPVMAIIGLAIVIWVHWGRAGPISPPYDAVVADRDRLRAQVDTDQNNLANNQRDIQALHAQLAELQKEQGPLSNLTFVQRYFENDPGNWVNMYWVSEALAHKLNDANTKLLITAASDTQPLADYIYNYIYNTTSILRVDQHLNINPPVVQPPKDTDLDAPKLPLPDFNGVAVYGASEDMQVTLNDMFSRIRPCFVVKYSKHAPAEIASYYKQSIVWIAIGHMPLWKERPCR